MTITPDGLDLRTVEAADVYLDDEVVASLERMPGDEIRFSYNDTSLHAGESVRDRSVSWSLLITDEHPVTTSGGAVPSFFAGLLPGRSRVGNVPSSAQAAYGYPLTLLLAIGADAIGNV